MDDSPLKKLPAELLNDIATLALQQDGDIGVWHPFPITAKFEDIKFTSTKIGASIPHPTAFAQTCKQLYYDYMPVFYSQNSFAMGNLSGYKCDLAYHIKAFLKAIGRKNASALASLLVDVEYLFWDLQLLELDLDDDVQSLLNATIQVFNSVKTLLRMAKFCKSMQLKIRFVHPGVDEAAYTILLDCKDMGRL